MRQNLSKSQKIVIVLTSIWTIIATLLSSVLANESYSGFNLVTFLISLFITTAPAWIYWAGVWIWGFGYIFKILRTIFISLNRLFANFRYQSIAVSPSATYLDDNISEHSYSHPSLSKTYILAPRKIRFVNFLIDFVIVDVLIVILDVFIGEIEYEVGFKLLSLIIFSAYYILFETFDGLTFGKLLTNTRVVSLSGRPLNFKQVVLRTIFRLVPFEVFTIFGKDGYMGHDSWSKTAVVGNETSDDIIANLNWNDLSKSCVKLSKLIKWYVLVTLSIILLAVLSIRLLGNSMAHKMAAAEKDISNAQLFDEIRKSFNINATKSTVDYERELEKSFSNVGDNIKITKTYIDDSNLYFALTSAYVGKSTFAKPLGQQDVRGRLSKIFSTAGLIELNSTCILSIADCDQLMEKTLALEKMLVEKHLLNGTLQDLFTIPSITCIDESNKLEKNGISYEIPIQSCVFQTGWLLTLRRLTEAQVRASLHEEDSSKKN